MNNLQSVKLGELLISLKTGLNPRDNFKLNTHDAENWYITVRELNGLGVDFLSQTDRVNDDALKLINNRSNLEVGDVLFSGTGTIGKTAIIDRYPSNWNIKEGVYSLKPKNDRIESYYLMYFLQHLNKLNVFSKISAGSTVFSVPMKNLEDLRIQIHKLPDQIKISNVLKPLDLKLELNNRINAELEAIAKIIYDYWFVQFDFPDKNGKPYKSSGGKMVWNEELKREIPEGWEVKKMGTIGEFKNGVNYNPAEPGDIPCPIINVRNISASSYFLKNEDLDIVYLDKSDVKKYSVHKGSIIIARSGIPGATRLIADFEKNTLYCGFAIHFDLINDSYKSPVFFFLKSIEQQIQNGSGGTIMKNVNQGTLSALQMPLPKEENLLLGFNELINPLFGKINQIQKENQQLASLRDWLLPMLMNGQVSVN